MKNEIASLVFGGNNAKESEALQGKINTLKQVMDDYALM